MSITESILYLICILLLLEAITIAVLYPKYKRAYGLINEDFEYQGNIENIHFFEGDVYFADDGFVCLDPKSNLFLYKSYLSYTSIFYNFYFNPLRKYFHNKLRLIEIDSTTI